MQDDFNERAAICEYDGGLPRMWAEALARICSAPKPEAYQDVMWDRLVHDAACFLSRWLKRISANGWTPEDIRNLIPLIRGREVIAVGMGEVTVRGELGAQEKLYRRPVIGGAARWDVGRRSA